MFRELPTANKIFLIIQAIAMLMGTSTHVAWALQHGFLAPAYNAPLFSMLFWDALTFLDPLAAAMLFLRPRLGTWLVLLIITADVVHNNLFYFDELYLQPRAISEWLAHYWMIWGQLLFAGFVWITLHPNLKAIHAVQATG